MHSKCGSPAADPEGHIVLSLFGVVFAGLLSRALLGVAFGIPAIFMFPWHLYSSPALRELRWATVREQVFSKAFFARPPPFYSI
jgi:hypothetical protein